MKYSQYNLNIVNVMGIEDILETFKYEESITNINDKKKDILIYNVGKTGRREYIIIDDAPDKKMNLKGDGTCLILTNAVSSVKGKKLRSVTFNTGKKNQKIKIQWDN